MGNSVFARGDVFNTVGIKEVLYYEDVDQTRAPLPTVSKILKLINLATTGAKVKISTCSVIC